MGAWRIPRVNWAAAGEYSLWEVPGHREPNVSAADRSRPWGKDGDVLPTDSRKQFPSCPCQLSSIFICLITPSLLETSSPGEVLLTV